MGTALTVNNRQEWRNAERKKEGACVMLSMSNNHLMWLYLTDQKHCEEFEDLMLLHSERLNMFDIRP